MFTFADALVGEDNSQRQIVFESDQDVLAQGTSGEPGYYLSNRRRL